MHWELHGHGLASTAGRHPAPGCAECLWYEDAERGRNAQIQKYTGTAHMHFTLPGQMITHVMTYDTTTVLAYVMILDMTTMGHM